MVAEITTKLSEFRSRLEFYGVSEIYIFGSYARNQHSVHSDIDLMAVFKKPIGFFKFLQLRAELSQLLNRPVDLISRDGLRSHMEQQILKECVRAA
jgi:uncharacterized protein